MLWKIFRVRLSEEDVEGIAAAAARLEISSAAMARMFIRDGLQNFDRKHDALMTKIADLQFAVDEANRRIDDALVLGAASIAATTSINAAQFDRSDQAERLRFEEKVKLSMKFGRRIKNAFAVLNKDEEEDVSRR